MGTEFGDTMRVTYLGSATEELAAAQTGTAAGRNSTWNRTDMLDVSGQLSQKVGSS